MGWHIQEIENTVEVSDEIAQELFDAQAYTDEYWYDLEDVVYDGLLTFSTDHMEHMDYLWNEEFQKILKKHKVKGRICFASYEGDNNGEFWGYEFDGKGNMVELVGTQTIKWTPRSEK